MEDPITPIEIGKASVLTTGDDLLILTIGRTLNDALDSDTELRALGISATIVNCRFVKPLDSKLILSLARNIGNIITIEENVLQGGFGSAVLELLSDSGITGYRVKRIGIDDTFVVHGSQDQLRQNHGITPEAVVKAAQSLLQTVPIEA